MARLDLTNISQSDLDAIQHMFVEVLKNGSSGGVKTAPVPKYSLKSPVPDTDAVSGSTQPGITLDGASLGATIIGQNPYTGGTDVTLQGYITFGGPAANNYGPNGYTMPELKLDKLTHVSTGTSVEKD